MHLLTMLQTAAQVAQAVGPEATEVKPYLVTAGLIFILQDWVKTQQWYRRLVKAFPGADKWAHRSVAGLGSFVTGVGIHWTYTGSLLAGGVFTAQLPPLLNILSNLVHTGSDVGGIYIMQQVIYMIAHRDVNTMAGHVDLQMVDVQGLPPAAHLPADGKA
jgi:hypothetical protein